MMPECHQFVPMSGHVEESETPKKIATIRDFNLLGLFLLSFVCQLDYGIVEYDRDIITDHDKSYAVCQ